MCTAQTAKRRRKQAANNYRHLDKMRRPKFKRISNETSAKRLQRTVERMKEIAARKGQRKK